MRLWRNWQTRKIQVLVVAIPWRFNSSQPHLQRRPASRAFFVFGHSGTETLIQDRIRRPAAVHWRPMALCLIGLDEAGYGPMLGPLCVGMSAVRIADWQTGQPAPDLWSLLSRGVSRRPVKSTGRIAIDDSKKLKLPNDGSRHPLLHLEKAVLCSLAMMDLKPTTDLELFAALGGEPESHPWYEGEAQALPIANDVGSLQIAGNMLASALGEAGVELLALRCCLVGEGRFNQLVQQRGTKAATTAAALGEHLGFIWEQWATVDAAGEFPRVVCDRQGGRTQYGGFLAELLPVQARGVPPIEVIVVEESPAMSRYEVRHEATGKRMSVLFQPEAESAHLPVALASMTAKLCRELMMGRFNRYWAARAAEAGIMELKPTAGYVQDARRWLRDAARVVTAGERKIMVRRA